MDSTVHIAITRIVKPGSEKEFEHAILDFFSKTTDFPGSLGAQLIRPIPGSEDRKYGIMRSFVNKRRQEAFYESAAFAEWVETVKPLVEENYERKPLHGLEAFFNDPSMATHPPKWKMAITTWLGVWPTVFLVSQVSEPFIKQIPRIGATGLVTLVVVILLSWAVMPGLIKLLRPWLKPVPADT